MSEVEVKPSHSACRAATVGGRGRGNGREGGEVSRRWTARATPPLVLSEHAASLTPY